MTARESIRRKDHETYFLDASEFAGMSGKKRRRRIEELLATIHPGFSVNAIYDLKFVKIEGKRWALITVMDRAILSEYRFLNPRRDLVTATTLAVNAKNFSSNGIRAYGDEIIGYSREQNKPVSLPAIDDGVDYAPGDTFRVSIPGRRRSIVFRKGLTPGLGITLAAAAAIFAIVFVLTGFIAFPRPPAAEEPATPKPKVKETVPDAFTILRDVSRGLVAAQGIMDRFEYDESSIFPVRLTVRDSEPLVVCRAMTGLSYLRLGPISGIEYRENKPRYSISWNINADSYEYRASRSFETGIAYLETQELLRKTNTDSRVAVVSEAIASPGDDSRAASVCVSVDDMPALFRNMRDCFAPDVHIARMTISVNRETRLAVVEYSITRLATDTPADAASDPATENAIPAAFDCEKKEVTPKEIVPPESPAKIPDDYERIGRIAVGERSSLVYYRNADGKIIAREE